MSTTLAYICAILFWTALSSAVPHAENVPSYETSKRQTIPSTWTCGDDHYNSGDECHCNCGAYDPDCDSSSTVVGCSAGDSCNSNALCVPQEWTCDPSYYQDGAYCDCGCGAVDPDCEMIHLPEGTDPAYFTFCADESEPDAGNAWICQIGECVQIATPPSTFTCNWNYYPDNRCFCGCGDEDCADTSAEVVGCPAGQPCTADGNTCVSPVPASWQCNPVTYDDGEYCDCNCGAYDPDCDDRNSILYNCPNHQYYCDNTGTCIANGTASNVPPEWTCDYQYYDGNDGCDCNCGAYDPDCSDSNAELYGCQQGEYCYTDGTCLHPDWNCDPAAYGKNEICECNCGVSDPDCFENGTASSNPVANCGGDEICVDGVCYDPQSGGTIPGWTCDPASFNANDGCNCNCGARDPDCDKTSAQADYVICQDGDVISNSTYFYCYSTSQVDRCVHDFWTCDPLAYNNDDLVCDCECGIDDPDCMDAGIPEITGCPDGQGEAVCPYGYCEQRQAPPEWTCNPNWYYAIDYCHCNCGAYDPDCQFPELEVVGCNGTDTCSADGECVPAQPPTTQPLTTQALTTQALTTQALTTHALTTHAAAPVTTKPVTTKPVTTKPLTTKPVTTKPLTTKAVTTKPLTTHAAAPVTTHAAAPVTTHAAAPVTTHAGTSPCGVGPAFTQQCCSASSYSGSSGYICNGNGSGFYYCLSGPFAPQSAHFACPAGTSCRCAPGVECSNGGTVSPCT
eukprot:TRINITY_DN7578_c0_g2_i1.p1 TRINITY_DN7578_c0_g2~~TRINITY_DN7578_c0_g2_i1.p1  ORF type:complete len:735 (-),score=109.60 TRINITY_DN7578_c0_g2_i1:129-2333(-)